MKICYNEANALNCKNASLETDVEECWRSGFEAIELRFDMLRAYLAQHSLDELKALFGKYPIQSAGINALYLCPELFTSHPGDDREAALLDDLALAGKLNETLGLTDVITVAPLNRVNESEPYGMPWPDAKRECVRILRELSSRARDHSLRICFEIVGAPRCAVRTLRQADEIISDVDRENVGLVLDSYNIYQFDKSNDFSYIRQLPAEKIYAVHINDADDVELGEIRQADRCFCGRGVIDLKGFMSNISAVGYDGIVSIETVRPGYWAQEQRAVIREAYATTYPAVKEYL